MQNEQAEAAVSQLWKPRLQLSCRCRGFTNAVNPRRAYQVNSPGILAHFANAISTLLRRRKVQMGELGDGVPERIIDLTLRAVTAMHMSDHPLRHLPRRCGR